MKKLLTQRKPTDPAEQRLHFLFDIGLILKGIDGALELIGGIALRFLSLSTIMGTTKSLTLHELSEDPHDFIANHLLRSAGHLTPHSLTFASIYLIVHGLVKLVVIVAVLLEKLWAYPVMIGLLGVFIVYQLYRIALHPTLGLSLLTLFDAAMLWLTWHEYKVERLKSANT